MGNAPAGWQALRPDRALFGGAMPPLEVATGRMQGQVSLWKSSE